MDPSPGRFARLVTQLKWRLLEGQGQAYYEIGVADSGLLIGLTKRDLEKSLETLEEMAGEIGASVIVTKEVEVPNALVKLAERVIQQGDIFEGLGMVSPSLNMPSYEDEEDIWRPGLGAWDRRSKRAEVLKSVDSLSSETTSTTTSTSATETEVETEDLVTDDDVALAPVVKTFQALNFDDFDLLVEDKSLCDDLGDDGVLFPFDPEPSHKPYPAEVPLLVPNQPSTTSLSISSVFKLRPRRQRSSEVTHYKADRRQQKIDARLHYQVSKANGGLVTSTELSKPERRRHARDRRRDLKRQALLSTTAASRADPTSLHEVVESFEECMVTVDDSATQDTQEHDFPSLEAATTFLSLHDDAVPATAAPVVEPRLIVEVLVVRKLSVGAATYGDFGFSFDFA